MHASRTDWAEEEALKGVECEKSREALEGVGTSKPVSGGRVSNTWVICPEVGNNCSKGQLIPHVVWRQARRKGLRSRFGRSPRPIS